MKTRVVILATMLLAVGVVASCEEKIANTSPEHGTTDSTSVINPDSIIISADGWIQNPQWLVHVLDSVSSRYNTPTGNKIYPWVYAVKHSEQEYILVVDALNSCWTCGNLYFTCSGNPIMSKSPYPVEDDLYWALANEENRTLLWKQSI